MIAGVKLYNDRDAFAQPIRLDKIQKANHQMLYLRNENSYVSIIDEGKFYKVYRHDNSDFDDDGNEWTLHLYEPGLTDDDIACLSTLPPSYVVSLLRGI